MLVTQQTLIGGYHVFSVLLELPEFEVVNQVFLEDCNLLHVEKNSTEELCSHCGFSSSHVHDWRTRKVIEERINFIGFYFFNRN